MTGCELCDSGLWEKEREQIDYEILHGMTLQWLRKWAKEKGIEIPSDVLWKHYEHLRDEHMKKSPLFREFGDSTRD